ncbi:MAG: hypothetical protein QM479_02235 [Pseudomonadota bacterium]
MKAVIIIFSLLASLNIAAQQFKNIDEAQEALEKRLIEKSYQQICKQQKQTSSDSLYPALFQHADSLKGDISRIYFLCEADYDLPLNSRQRRIFQIWDIKDPVSIVECKREKHRNKQPIGANRYVYNRC